MPEPIWSPPEERVRRSALFRFMAFASERTGRKLGCYHDLYRWSITDIPAFWGALWDFTGVVASRRFEQVVDDPKRLPGAHWFSGARLNFAENLLRCRDDSTAIISKAEEGETRRLSHAGLYRSVSRLAHALQRAGVRPGDRVAGFLPNVPETVIAMLASVSVGAAWSSCSPDFGSQGVLDRLGQIEPKILFAARCYRYGGRSFDNGAKISEIAARIPSIEKVILIEQTCDAPSPLPSRSATWDEFTSGIEDRLEVPFVQSPPDQPLYIMYSSGTTGPPKCMVQGAAGILLQHLKELVLHTDLGPGERIVYLTTCGWMMWNWLVSALACGSTIVLYDGHPFHPEPATLWRFLEEERIAVFGTSARYLASLQSSGLRPREEFDLSALRTILSTGSPLSPDGFRYVYREIKSDLQLASISGGTDLNGCFALGNPTGPVYPGELQCRGLGMKVEVYNQAGEPVIGEPGELVCSAAFPSMPLYFWNDPEGARYRKAYFEKYPGVWAHGDWCTLTESGGMIIHGRSDATLNPGGIRIGSAELYRVLEGMPELADSLAVGQHWQGDERVILFVKLAQGGVFSEELKERIAREIREKISPRHVPAKIVPIAEIPYTINMKKVELAVRQVIHGEEVANREALANPEALELYRDLPELQS